MRTRNNNNGIQYNYTAYLHVFTGITNNGDPVLVGDMTIENHPAGLSMVYLLNAAVGESPVQAKRLVEGNPT